MARLFEQGGDVTPELDKRVAWGKVGEPTQNSSWAKILTWLESALGFLRKDANLSDLTSKNTARENLGVYSTGQVDTKLGDRALRNNVLEKNNTTPYTPTSSYHPATLKYVNEHAKNDFIYTTQDSGNVTQLLAKGINKILWSVILMEGGSDNDRTVILPTAADLTNIYGASLGFTLTIVLQHNSTDNLLFPDQLINNNGDAQGAVRMRKGDVLTIMYAGLSRPDKWIIVDYRE